MTEQDFSFLKEGTMEILNLIAAAISAVFALAELRKGNEGWAAFWAVAATLNGYFFYTAVA